MPFPSTPSLSPGENGRQGCIACNHVQLKDSAPTRILTRWSALRLASSVSHRHRALFCSNREFSDRYESEQCCDDCDWNVRLRSFAFDRAGGRGSPFIGNDRDRLASTDESRTIVIVSGGTTGYQEARFRAAFLSRQRLSSLLPWRNQPSGFARPARTLPRPERLCRTARRKLGLKSR